MNKPISPDASGVWSRFCIKAVNRDGGSALHSSARPRSSTEPCNGSVIKEDCMKTRFSILTGIAALALVFGLAAMAACSNPTGGGSGGTPQPAPAPQSTVLMGMDDSGKAYVLEITENTASRAAYAGKKGDGFKLIIILADVSRKE
jgi:hypothetical protein